MEGNGSHSTHSGSLDGGNPRGSAVRLDDLDDDMRKRVLLVADEAFHVDDFLAELRHRGYLGSPRRLSVLVITPALPGSALGRAANDIDGAVVDAYSRLDTILAELRGVGIPTAGMVGDDDPVVALGDGLRLFDADDVVVIGHVEHDADWAERNLWERLETSFEEEISALLVERPEDGTAVPETVETRTSIPAEGDTARGSTTPESRVEAVIGILTGLSGTIALGFLVVGAADSAAPAEGDIAGPIAAMILITVGAFLFNLAAAVALLFSIGLDYRGFWQRFIARTTIALTLSCLVASALVWAIFL